MYRYESWAIKKAEHQRIDAFKLVVLEKTVEGPLDCKIIPVNRKGSPEFSLKVLNIHWKD